MTQSSVGIQIIRIQQALDDLLIAMPSHQINTLQGDLRSRRRISTSMNRYHRVTALQGKGQIIIQADHCGLPALQHIRHIQRIATAAAHHNIVPLVAVDGAAVSTSNQNFIMEDYTALLL
jgi:hypothetical protein